MPKTLETLLAELRHRLSGLYGDRLAGLFLYGSQARGDAVTGSDIDVLVVLKGPVYPAEEIERTLDVVAGLSFEHDEVVNCVFASERDFAEHDSPLLLNVRQEGVPI